MHRLSFSVFREDSRLSSEKHSSVRATNRMKEGRKIIPTNAGKKRMRDSRQSSDGGCELYATENDVAFSRLTIERSFRSHDHEARERGDEHNRQRSFTLSLFGVAASSSLSVLHILRILPLGSLQLFIRR